MDADAMVKREEIAAIERGEFNFEDIYFKPSGIKSLKLTKPADQAAFGRKGFGANLKKGVVMETPTSRTSVIQAFIYAQLPVAPSRPSLALGFAPRKSHKVVCHSRTGGAGNNSSGQMTVSFPTLLSHTFKEFWTQ
jgi:hypothetical protein